MDKVYFIRLVGHARSLLARMPDDSSAEEVLETFIELMAGIGFMQTSIVRAMQKLSDERAFLLENEDTDVF